MLVNFSAFDMMLRAGLMVQLVMLTLLAFSVASWAVVLTKLLLLRRVRRESSQFIDIFWNSKNLNEAAEAAGRHTRSPEAAVFLAGFRELQKSPPTSGQEETLGTRLAFMDNLKRSLSKTHEDEMAHINRSLPVLATTGSATPFIGLFGTVWGIMTSFHDIGLRGSASLAVVAPGISEALEATAAGLAVAIPAVVFYNYLSNRFEEIDTVLRGFSTDLLNLVERDILTRMQRGA